MTIDYSQFDAQLEVRVREYPAIGLAQSQSPEVLKRVKGFEAGTLYSNEIINDEKVRVPLGTSVNLIPLFIYPGKPRAKYNDRLDQDSPMIDCQSLKGDVGTKYGKCRTCCWALRDADPKVRCYDQIVGIFAVPGKLDEPKRIIFNKSKFVSGEDVTRMFVSNLVSSGPNVCGRMITVSSKIKENKRTNSIYNVFDITAGPEVPAKELPAVKEAVKKVIEHYIELDAQFKKMVEEVGSEVHVPVDSGAINGAANEEVQNIDFELPALEDAEAVKGADAIL